MSVGLEEGAALVLVDCYNNSDADPLLDGAYGYYELYDADTSFDPDFQSLVERWGKVVLELVWAVVVQASFGLCFFFNTVQGNLEQAAMHVPLPLFCLIGLWWVRWWAIRPPSLLAVEDSNG